MSRHGLIDAGDCEHYGLYRGTVARILRSKRGQAFLKELADAMDAMPDKSLIAGDLIDDDGGCCAIGTVCKSRGIDVSKIDYEDPEQVGAAVGIAHQMASEIEFENDEGAWDETPEQRWHRMRKWVSRNMIDKPA